jgi:hypothetical protein
MAKPERKQPVQPTSFATTGMHRRGGRPPVKLKLKLSQPELTQFHVIEIVSEPSGTIEEFRAPSKSPYRCMARKSSLRPSRTRLSPYPALRRSRRCLFISSGSPHLPPGQRSAARGRVRALAWCLMTNHVHFVVVPEREDSLAAMSRRAHGRCAQHLNAAARTHRALVAGSVLRLSGGCDTRDDGAAVCVNGTRCVQGWQWRRRTGGG